LSKTPFPKIRWALFSRQSQKPTNPDCGACWITE
jgi:hypothetical protein